MIKLSVFPKCFIDDIWQGRMSLFDWIEMAAELEPDGLELYSRFLKETTPQYLAEVRKAIEDKGFAMPMMCYSPDFTVPDREARADEIARQKQIIEITAQLGGSFCRVLSGQRRPELGIDDGVAMVVDAIQDCIETARACNVTLVMENHYKDGFWEYPEFAQQHSVFLKIVEQIDSDFFGVQFDPSNSIVAGEDPIELLCRIKHRVKTMHASDRSLAPGATLEDLKAADGTAGYSTKLLHGVIGKGLNDYDRIFAILRDAGYDSWVSIEDGMNGMQELHESMGFLRRMQQKYFA